MMCGLALLTAVSEFARADDLTLYFFPSQGINWKSPSTLLGSVAKNLLMGDEYLIGHVTIEVKCDADNIRFHAGMSFGDFDESKDLILKQGAGVSVLLVPMKGRLEKSRSIERYLREDAEYGEMSFLRTFISRSTCQRLAQYYSEYVERNYGAFYGLKLRPRYGEGSGCSAFGMSFLELAGLLDPEFETAVRRRVLVPESWMGYPLTDKMVRVYDLWKQAKQWATESEPNIELNFWDPDLMYSWVHRKISEIERGGERRMSLAKWGASRGLLWDRRDVPTPSGPIWLKD
ncbi:MAG: hypothetical protein KA715_07085 [Xanthomonadaceae bacterium]|nr:hypothetical protein [Xanthomonadaceae bacterium]